MIYFGLALLAGMAAIGWHQSAEANCYHGKPGQQHYTGCR
jgi:hypothetical protein